jgi:hypothetical protein
MCNISYYLMPRRSLLWATLVAAGSVNQSLNAIAVGNSLAGQRLNEGADLLAGMAHDVNNSLSIVGAVVVADWLSSQSGLDNQSQIPFVFKLLKSSYMSNGVEMGCDSTSNR